MVRISRILVALRETDTQQITRPPLLDCAVSDERSHVREVDKQSLARELESSGLESTQTFSWSDITSPVRVGKVLQYCPNLPDLARLDALVDIANDTFLLLLADAAGRKEFDCVIDPTGHLRRHELEHGQKHTASIWEAIGRECVHHAGHDPLSQHFTFCANDSFYCFLNFWWIRGRPSSLISKVT